MHMWLCSAKNRSRLRKFYHFLLHFPLRFPLLLAAQRRAENAKGGESEINSKRLMSEMPFSNPSYLVLISFPSKDDSILIRKKIFFSQKNAFYHLYLFRNCSVTFPRQLISDSPPFLPNLKKGYIFLPANEMDLLFFLTAKMNAGDVVSSIKLHFIEYLNL